MDKKIGLIIILVIILIAIISFTLLYTTGLFNSTVDSIIPKEENVLGEESYGNVVVKGPYGNTSSNVKIAYVVGLHPRENASHQAFLDTFYKNENLKYCYYIYEINVTQGIEDYEQSRMNGQLLAQTYVLPNALDKNLSLVVDVHSNAGNWDENQFVFSPLNGSKGEQIAKDVLKNCTFSTYYYPPNPTSHVYLTLPLNEKGIPAFFWEEYDKNSGEVMRSHMNSLIQTVDNLQF